MPGRFLFLTFMAMCWLLRLSSAADNRSAGSNAFPRPDLKALTNHPVPNIQRTMQLLATTKAGLRPTVKILFYGQSITEQQWWRSVAEDLKKRFPSAHLTIENRAIGGFSSQLLVKTAETDLYSFYPDLLIFHVYGSHLEYQNLIRSVRERTTAEILLQTDHITKDAQLTEETDPQKLTPKSWDAWMNHVFLPGTAKTYGAELADIHSFWKRYLKEHKLPAAQLLKDSVHLNDHGNFLMAELIKAHLRPQPVPKVGPSEDLVTTHLLDSATSWHEGKLFLPVDGNRIDLIPSPAMFFPALRPGSGQTAVRVLIDGKRPSEFPELYGFTRTTSYPGSGWPCLLRVDSRVLLQIEEWTVTLKDLSADHTRFKFNVRGSRTGPDGDGVSDQRFVSKSGRVVIDPADWNLAYAFKTFKTPLPAGFEIRWQVVPYFLDEIDPSLPSPAPPGVEPAITIAQGLNNGRHQLELYADFPPPIAAVRVYRPPRGRD